MGLLLQLAEVRNVSMPRHGGGGLKLLVPYLLLGGRPPENLSLFHAAHFALAGGISFRQTRAAVKGSAPPEAAVWTGLEEMLNAALSRRQPDLSLYGSRRLLVSQ